MADNGHPFVGKTIKIGLRHSREPTKQLARPSTRQLCSAAWNCCRTSMNQSARIL